MAYSQDYRQMILEKLNSGYSYRELAAEYGISRSIIQLWKKCIERKPYPKRTNKINDELLRKDVEQFPDDFQRERAVRFNCSQRAIGVALKRLKITQKKILKHPKAQPETIEPFLSLKQQYEQEKRPIVYIDESGFKKTNLSSLCLCAKRTSLSWQSQLANQKHKQCHWRTVPKSINCSGFV